MSRHKIMGLALITAFLFVGLMLIPINAVAEEDTEKSDRDTDLQGQVTMFAVTKEQTKDKPQMPKEAQMATQKGDIVTDDTENMMQNKSGNASERADNYDGFFYEFWEKEIDLETQFE